MDQAGKRFSRLITERHLDGHAPGGLELGEGEVDFGSLDLSGGDFEFLFVEVFGAVILRTLEAPDFDGEVFRLYRRGVDFIGEGDFDTGFGGFNFGREMSRLVGFADAVEAAGFALVATPGEHAAAVELAVFRMESSTHDAGGKLFKGEFAHAALVLSLDFFVRDDEYFSVAVRKI